jgi:4-oxalocrotonate tautomerase
MPHVVVKLWPGKSEQQKKKLAQEVTKAVAVASPSRCSRP